MALTAQDIHSKQFSKSFRGYDVDEVNQFLDEVIRDYDALTRERDELILACEELQQYVDRFQNIEHSLNKSILLAQETAEEVKRNAMQEGRMTLKEAEKNADRIINDALMKASKISLEVEDMKHQANIFKSRMKMLLETQLDMLSSESWKEAMSLELKTEGLSEELELPDELTRETDLTAGYEKSATKEVPFHSRKNYNEATSEALASAQKFDYMSVEEEPSFSSQRETPFQQETAFFQQTENAYQRQEPSFQQEDPHFQREEIASQQKSASYAQEEVPFQQEASPYHTEKENQENQEGKFVSYFNQGQVEQGSVGKEEPPSKTFRFRYNHEE